MLRGDAAQRYDISIQECHPFSIIQTDNESDETQHKSIHCCRMQKKKKARKKVTVDIRV